MTERAAPPPLDGVAAIVLAAGLGTRMRSRLPKPLHPIAGRAMIHHICDLLSRVGVSDIVVVASAEDGAVAQAVEDRARIAVQSEALGTGHAALAARAQVGEAAHVLILNSDLPLLSTRTLREFTGRHLAGDAVLTFLTAYLDDPTGYGRVVRRNGRLAAIVEETETDAATRGEPEVNAGLYAARTAWLWPALEAIEAGPRGERYLTDLIGRAVAAGEPVQTHQVAESAEVQQVSNRVDLARVEQLMRERIRHRLMEKGVTLIDPRSTFVDAGVTVGADSTLLPGVHLSGATTIGEGCHIGPHAVVHDTHIGDHCTVGSATLNGAELADGVTVGPYCHVRPGTRLESGVRLGTHAEVNRSRVGPRSQVNHFSYVGDADVGADVNIGAGAITANYDGEAKHPTRIGDGAFIGSDSILVAPVEIGPGARTAAGAVVTKDVPAGTLAIGAPARIRSQGLQGSRVEPKEE